MPATLCVAQARFINWERFCFCNNPLKGFPSQLYLLWFGHFLSISHVFKCFHSWKFRLSFRLFCRNLPKFSLSLSLFLSMYFPYILFGWKVRFSDRKLLAWCWPPDTSGRFLIVLIKDDALTDKLRSQYRHRSVISACPWHIFSLLPLLSLLLWWTKGTRSYTRFLDCWPRIIIRFALPYLWF